MEPSLLRVELPVQTRVRTPGRWLSTVSCALWGHHVDNRVFQEAATAGRRCRCGHAYLAEDGSLTRVRHTLSCFLGHHTYKRLTDRDNHHEYVCIRCGHPLLFEAARDPYAGAALFAKKVRYVCGLFGHRVHRVTARNGFAEYACHCGHTFLKVDDGLEKVTHPMVCVIGGHVIRYVTRRAQFAEYVCRDCGHPFCFAESPTR